MTASKAFDSNDYVKSTKKVIARRGVLWLGQTCNIRCHFCYWRDRITASAHPEHPFMSLEKAKHICRSVREFYFNNSIDIQGGEPLLFKGIYELVKYCREIGLIPTLITNGILLSQRKICERLAESGIRDLLISVHALGEVYDRIVGVQGSSVRQMQGLANCQDVGIPFRFNAVLSKWALPQYVDIAQTAVRTGARVVNFIAFNPFGDQSEKGKRSNENVARYGDIAVELNKALDVLEQSGIEANVRYIPLCIVEKRHRKSMYNYQQLSYDLHEWDFASWSWTDRTPQRIKDGPCSPLITLEEANYADGWDPDGSAARQLSWTRAKWIHLRRSAFDELTHYPRTRIGLQRVYWVLKSVFGRTVKRRHGAFPDPLNRDPELYRSHARLRAQYYCKYVYPSACAECAARTICDGFHCDYFDFFGGDEAQPIKALEEISDPCFFINDQEKIVEKEDCDWVLRGVPAS